MNPNYVIYKSTTCQIVKITNDEPLFSKMKPDEDYDTVANWSKLSEFHQRITSFLASNLVQLY